MKPFLFQFNDPIAPGQYLHGSPRWTQNVSIMRARIACQAGNSTQPTILQFEADGELIDKRIPLLPLEAGEDVHFPFQLDFVLPAQTELRLKCVSGPVGQADAVRRLGVSLALTEANQAPVELEPALTDELYVVWVNGSEVLRLFEYSTTTHAFTETSPGISSGRAEIVNGPNCDIRIQGTSALQIGDDQILQCAMFNATGGTAATAALDSPRLEFWQGAQRYASLTKSGSIYIVDLTETGTLLGGSDRFELFGNGELAAVIGSVGLTGLSFLEN